MQSVSDESSALRLLFDVQAQAEITATRVAAHDNHVASRGEIELREVERRVREDTEPRRVREDSEPRRFFASEPARLEMPRFRLFGNDD